MNAPSERTLKWKSWFGADLFCVVLLVAVCLLIALPRYRCGIDFTDEGLLAYGAVRVTEGQVPNRDFVSLQPPLPFYTVAAMFKLFGTSLASLRILGMIIHLLIPLLVYGITRNLAAAPSALAAAMPTTVLGLPFSYFVPFPVWQGITATLGAVLLYLQAGLHKRAILALPAGIITALSVFSRHDQGFYLVISIAVLTLCLRFAKEDTIPQEKLRRVFTLWIVGGAIAILPFGVYWWLQGALPEMYKQLVAFPLTTYAKTSSLPFPKFSPHLPFREIVFTSLYYIPPALGAIVAMWLTRQLLAGRFHRNEAVIAFLLVWSGFFYCQVITRSDPYHLLITLAPFCILAGSCWGVLLKKLVDALDEEASRRGLLKFAKDLGSIFPGACAIWLAWTLGPLCLPSVTKATELIALDRGGVRMEGGQLVTDLVRVVQSYAPPNRAILCLPYQPMFYFLCERRNPTRWNYLWPGDETAEDHNAMIQQAKSDPPAAVLIIGESKMRSYAPAIIDYVNNEYEYARDVDVVRIDLPRKR